MKFYAILITALSTGNDVVISLEFYHNMHCQMRSDLFDDVSQHLT